MSMSVIGDFKVKKMGKKISEKKNFGKKKKKNLNLWGGVGKKKKYFKNFFKI